LRFQAECKDLLEKAYRPSKSAPENLLSPFHEPMDNAVRIIGNCIKWMLVKPMGIAKNPKTLARAHMIAIKAICLELILTFFLYRLLRNNLNLHQLKFL
jgi:hypothetical protein